MFGLKMCVWREGASPAFGIIIVADKETNKLSEMKKVFLTSLLVLLPVLTTLFPGLSSILPAQTASAQTVYTVNYKSDADVKVYVASYKSDADLVVYKCKYKSDAEGNKGLWHWVNYKSDAKKTIYFVQYKSDADIVIYFTDYKSDAGWKNQSKMHLMY